jgi:hypothetical protein
LSFFDFRVQDYLKSAGKGWRIACAIACTFATVLFLLFFVLLCVMAYQQHGFHRDALGFAAALLIMAFLGSYTSYLAWKLWHGSVSRNGVTTMPTWFIQIFGVWFLAGAIAVAAAGGSKEFLGETIAIGLAMLFVGRNISKRKNAKKR